MSVRVAVVAASPVVRAGLEQLLGQGDDVVVVGAAASREALAELHVGDIDVLVLDDDTGVRVQALRGDAGDDEAMAAPPTVLLVDHPSATVAREALSAGARGVLERDVSGDELVAAVRAVAAGLVVLAPDAARPASPGRGDRRATVAVRGASLSARELEVLQLIAEGLANKQVAARLGVSEHTVKTHVGGMFEKLDVATRAEAVARGVQLGLLML